MKPLRSAWRFLRRLVRTGKILARDPAVPRPLRWMLGIGLLPWPGPVDEIVWAVVVAALAIFYPRPLRRAWRETARHAAARPVCPH